MNSPILFLSTNLADNSNSTRTEHEMVNFVKNKMTLWKKGFYIDSGNTKLKQKDSLSASDKIRLISLEESLSTQA